MRRSIRGRSSVVLVLLPAVHAINTTFHSYRSDHTGVRTSTNEKPVVVNREEKWVQLSLSVLRLTLLHSVYHVSINNIIKIGTIRMKPFTLRTHHPEGVSRGRSCEYKRGSIFVARVGTTIPRALILRYVSISFLPLPPSPSHV